MKLDDVGPFTQLDCVQARMQGQQPLECARAIVSVVREALTRLEDGPSRRAVALLMGAGTTWGLLRKDRRKAAAEVLVVGEVHFRKYRELGLLLEVGEQICALEAEYVAQRQQPGFTEAAKEASAERHDADQEIVTTGVAEPPEGPNRPLRRNVRGAVVLVVVASALLILILETRRSPQGPAGGMNGQQISYCPKEVNAHGTAYVSGPNQGGNMILNHPVSLSGSCGLETNWWWVGDVDIVWDDSNGHYVGSTTCHVPRKQKSRDWVFCYAPH
jgi:hypothetical protein